MAVGVTGHNRHSCAPLQPPVRFSETLREVLCRRKMHVPQFAWLPLCVLRSTRQPSAPMGSGGGASNWSSWTWVWV